MKAAYLVIYEGEPEDRETFLRFYVEHHVPIMWRLPKLRGVQIELGVDGRDAYANEAGVFMVARYPFSSLDDLRAALQSDGREAARRDRDRFPPFNGQIRHQAVEILEAPLVAC